MHTHSPFATAWAQARRDLPCLGTTHADHFRGSVPVTRRSHAAEIDGDYEEQTGAVIVETFAERRSTRSMCRPHSSPRTGRSCGAPTSRQAVENAVALEAVAASALPLGRLAPGTRTRSRGRCSRSTSRASTAHGAYYGQPT